MKSTEKYDPDLESLIVGNDNGSNLLSCIQKIRCCQREMLAHQCLIPFAFLSIQGIIDDEVVRQTTILRR